MGKQRVECLQILNALLRQGGWANHPAVLMWKGHESALIEYAEAMCNEWIGRGYRDSVETQLHLISVSPSRIPAWLGDERLHSSHRANLLRKNFAHYSQFGWTEDPSTPYWWP